jgi:hypothetical protein
MRSSPLPRILLAAALAAACSSTVQAGALVFSVTNQTAAPWRMRDLATAEGAAHPRRVTDAPGQPDAVTPERAWDLAPDATLVFTAESAQPLDRVRLVIQAAGSPPGSLPALDLNLNLGLEHPSLAKAWESFRNPGMAHRFRILEQDGRGTLVSGAEPASTSSGRKRARPVEDKDKDKERKDPPPISFHFSPPAALPPPASSQAGLRLPPSRPGSLEQAKQLAEHLGLTVRLHLPLVGQRLVPIRDDQGRATLFAPMTLGPTPQHPQDPRGVLFLYAHGRYTLLGPAEHGPYAQRTAEGYQVYAELTATVTGPDGQPRREPLIPASPDDHLIALHYLRTGALPTPAEVAGHRRRLAGLPPFPAPEAPPVELPDLGWLQDLPLLPSPPLDGSQ